jgi:hypothetical protein
MGRPVNKRYFGSGSGSQIKVRFKTSGTEYNGYVVKQTGSKRFKVSDGTRTITGYLVNKSNGGLDNGDVVINVLNDAGAFVQVVKLYNRVAITETDTKIAWNFTASESDSAVQMQDVEGPTITFLTQPLSQTLDLSESTTDTVTFTVNITGVPEADVSYQWKVSTNGGSSYSNVSTGTGGTTASYTIAAQTDTSATGYKYKCTVTASTAGVSNSPVDSSVATLTVQA